MAARNVNGRGIVGMPTHRKPTKAQHPGLQMQKNGRRNKIGRAKQ
jgi:hypothetical protein